MTENKKRGLLVVVSGFSGAGKGTLIRELLRQYPNYRLSVSATTRAPRAGEEDGKDYFFVSRERFEEMIAGHKLIEYASYVGNYYGTPRDYVEEMLAAGNDVILEIEIQGALKVKDIFPEAVFVFVAPPDAETLEQRLTGRGTENAETIAALADGSLGRAYALAAEGLALRDEAITLLTRLRTLSIEDIWARAAEIGARTHAERTAWIGFLQMALRDLLILHEDGAASELYHIDRRTELIDLRAKLTRADLFALMEEMRRLTRRFAANVNPALQIEAFLLRARKSFA